MQASHDLGRVSISFDEPNLVSHAGLLAPAELAQRLGVAQLVAGRVHLTGTAGAANADIKVMTLVGGLLAGADSIDDMDVMRTGATSEVFAVRAPSTLGTFLRSFSFGDVRCLDAVTRQLLARAWAAGAGPAPGADVTIDLDSTICEVYGLTKQGAGFGYTGVRGYHPLLATCAGDGDGRGATQLLHSRLRGGNAYTARGAGSFVAETLARLREALPADDQGRQGRVLLRADSGSYSRAVVRAARTTGALFSITVRANPSIRAAIAGIDEGAWTAIPYWSSDGVFGYTDDGTPISGADVAELPYTAFAGTPDALDVRLVVRRVRPTPGSQLALDVVFDYHAFITDRDGNLLTVEADHRRHAVIEKVIEDLKNGCGPVHMPSAKFAANAAWLVIAAIAYNLGRWCAALAGADWARVTTATLRRKLLTVPGWLVHSARRVRLRLPENWPWQQDLLDLRKAIGAITPALT